MSANGYTKGDPQKVAKTGDTMSGDLVLNDATPNTSLSATPKSYVDNSVMALSADSESRFVNVAGDNMSGALRLAYGSINTDVGHDLTVVASTGIVHQDGPITSAGPTSVNIPAGLAIFVAPHHVHEEPLIRTVEYGDVVVTLDNLVSPLTYFMVNDSGQIIQNLGVPTRAQRRQYAVLGRVVVLGGTITSVQDSPILAAQPLNTTLDILSSLGDVRVSGIVVTPIPGTMTFAVSSGNILNLGANNINDPNDPNVTMFNAVSPGAFRYVTQSGVVDVTPRTVLDPGIYDVGGVVTAVPGGAGTTTIQRVHCYPTQNIFVQLGQIAFGSLGAAIDAITLGDTTATPYITNPSLVGGGVRTAFLLLTKNATNLADTAHARIARATKLGDPGGTP